MNIEKEREAFEDKLKRMGKVDDSTFAKNEDGSYQMDIIHFGWKIWQAAKAQAVPEGFVLVSMNLPESIAETMAKDAVRIPPEETDHIWNKISSDAYNSQLLNKKWEFIRDYKRMINAQEQNQ